MTQPPLFTADDWGLSPGVNDGILDLATAGVVRRVSCMANGGYVEHRLRDLLAIPHLELGLHFNVTFERPDSCEPMYESLVGQDGGFRSFREHLLRSFGPGRLPLMNEMNWAMRSQLKRLTGLGVTVAYVDGHHHAHLVPGVLEACKEVLLEHGIRSMRLPLDLRLLVSRKAPVYWLAWWNRSKLKANGMVARRCIYPTQRRLERVVRNPSLLSRWGGCEVITHPAKVLDFDSSGVEDSYRTGRLEEYRLLMGLAPRILSDAAQRSPGASGIRS